MPAFSFLAQPQLEDFLVVVVVSGKHLTFNKQISCNSTMLYMTGDNSQIFHTTKMTG